MDREGRGRYQGHEPGTIQPCPCVACPRRRISLIGRHGTLVVAASLFVGLFVPGLAAASKSLLGPAIVVMLTLAFLRVDPTELRHHWTQPGLIAAATVWVMLVLPAALGLLFLATDLHRNMSGQFFMLVLQASAPGLMSSPALAALMGLDVALTLASLILCTAITSLTASLFTRVIDGLSVIAMFLFAVAAMDGVADHFRADPLLVVGLTLLAFALAPGLIAVTALVFARAGRGRAFAIGLIAGNRNIGLMLAATGFAVRRLALFRAGGRAVGDIFVNAGLKPIRVSIAAGSKESRTGNRRFSVSKQILISNLDGALHTGELRFAQELHERTAMAEELKDFSRHVSEAGRYSFSARSGKHDDLVLAVAIALWRVKRKRPSWDDGRPRREAKVAVAYARSKGTVRFGP
jgi:hypothetical protein